MDLHRLKRLIQFDTAGWMAVSSLLVCCISGVLLSIPYDFVKAYRSLFDLLLHNPAGSFIRNLHYWSAQLFFILSLLHIWDHLSKSTESNIRKKRTWFILCLVTLFLGYEMLSGFILKGDAAGMQARRILASILESIPFAGKMLGSAFTGSDENWLVVYVQHVATGTILLFIGFYEHQKSIWPRSKTFSIVLAFLIGLSLVFRAPLGLAESTNLKGPWFFVGIQEMLHWTSYPLVIMVLFLILFALLYFLPDFSETARMRIKRMLLAAVTLYLLATVLVLLFRRENWEWKVVDAGMINDEPRLIFDPVGTGMKSSTMLPENGKAEGCLLCHSAMKGLSESHNPAIIGCFACHKGDPFSSDKSTAHRNMILVPGNFSNVRQTCGTRDCHREISDRLEQSLMTIESGIIAVDKFVFQESGALDSSFHVAELGHSAADTHLRNLCAGCHLGKEKISTGNASWLERGGGCNACHLVYSDKATASMNRMRAKAGEKGEEIHPAIDIRVTNDRCMSCHSRSGRISLSYEGWNETTMKSTEVKDTARFKVLPDERVLEFVQADVHHLKGLACIDCHTSYEIMGDGKRHYHKEGALSVQCIDCHPAGKPKSVTIAKLPDRESQMLAWLRKYNPAKQVIVTANGSQPLLNTRVDSLGHITLTDKLDNREHPSKPMSPVCSRGKGHERLSCQSCHTAWVPQCIGCHNAYEKNSSGFDMLTGKPTKGTWIEYAGKTFAEPPVLGVNDADGGKVVTVMPGMIMTIDRESFAPGNKNSFHRFYAPASGHTTQRTSRSCKSCHNDPLAIGYGRGVLRFDPSGTSDKWIFEPRFAMNENDRLPEDAWVGFLKEARAPYATRSGLRPFTVKEQQRILEVGSCLTCHEEKSKAMERALKDFPEALAGRSSKCNGQSGSQK